MARSRSWHLVVPAVALVGFLGTWAIPVITQLLVMDSVGIDVADVHDLETGETHVRVASSVVAIAGLALAIPCTVVLLRRLGSLHLGHPIACLGFATVTALVSLGMLGARFERVEEAANRDAVFSLAVANGMDAEAAGCLADGLDASFELADGIAMTRDAAETIFRTSLTCRHIMEPGATGCEFTELLGAARPGGWPHPADALLPFERGHLDTQDVERASIRCRPDHHPDEGGRSLSPVGGSARPRPRRRTTPGRRSVAHAAGRQTRGRIDPRAGPTRSRPARTC